MAVLDFLVIGAPSAGTEVLTVVGQHPQVAFPTSAETPVFTAEHRYVFGPEWFQAGCFADKADGAVRGMVSPQHMSGLLGAGGFGRPIEDIAAGMVRTLPDVKLIAVLRDPVERARAHHRGATRRGLERRPLDVALRSVISPGALSRARVRPRETTGYVAWGEYGRILTAYRKHYAQSQILVLLARDLERDPATAIARVARHIGVDETWQPRDADIDRVAVAQELRIEPSATAELVESLRRSLPGAVAAHVEQAVENWNRGNDVLELADDLEGQLRGHFAVDALALEDCCALRVPWAESPSRKARAPAGAAPEVSIVVLVHETPREAQDLLSSIVRNTEGAYEIVLVDNGSSAVARDALAAIADTYGALLVRLDENLVFSTAINAGVKASRGDDIALLNSDVVVTPRWLSNLRTALHSAPDIAIVGPRSNNVHSPQGPIWVDDVSEAGIQRYGRFFNHSDPTRWFENRRLSGFAMLARRAALEASGGFDEEIPWFGLEDKELCDALAGAGWRLLCAGDTFIFHMGHRTVALTGFNRTASRFGRTNAPTPNEAKSNGSLVKDDQGEVFELHDGVASHIETGLALRLVRGDRRVRTASPHELAALPVGAPIHLIRARGTEDVWVLQNGWRRRVTGDKHRIRRLTGISIAEPTELEAIPLGPDAAIEDALASVPELKPILPANPAEIVPERLAAATVVAAEIAAALSDGRGYGLIRLDGAETLALNEGMWRVDEDSVDLELAGAGEDSSAAAAAIRDAIIDADAVGVIETRDRFLGAPLLEQILFHLDLYPRLRCSSKINYQLLGGDPATGATGARAPLFEALDGRPVAIAGPSELVSWAIWHRRHHLRSLGLDVRLGVGLDRLEDLEPAFAELAEQRELYDAVLVFGDIPAKPLCARVARELSAVGIDLGHALDRALHPRYVAESGVLRAARQVSLYLRQLRAPAPEPPHELEGRLVRERGKPGVWFIERGMARLLPHRELLPLFDQEPVELDHDGFESLTQGIPLCVVHERFAGTYLLLGGEKRPLVIGLPFAVIDDTPAGGLGVNPSAVHWYPGGSNTPAPG